MRRAADGSLEPVFEDQVVARSQDLPDVFCPTGAIWWAKADVLRDTGTYHVPGRTGWELPWERGIDIDTEDDWRLAELLLAASGPTARSWACRLALYTTVYPAVERFLPDWCAVVVGPVGPGLRSGWRPRWILA